MIYECIHTEKEKGSQSQWPRHTAQGSPSHLRHTEFAKNYKHDTSSNMSYYSSDLSSIIIASHNDMLIPLFDASQGFVRSRIDTKPWFITMML